jgi:heme a synthase
MSDKIFIRFRRMALLTVWATIFLIWVGGLVRSTGSGMGCPDWPKCFGRIVPPTDVSELPADYKEHYAALRKAKNQRIAKSLSAMGFSAIADKIVNDPSVYIEEDFNATKTWIEYINRLIGVLVGLFIFLTFVFSLPIYKHDKKITLLAFVGFVLVGVEGWLGSIVVSTNLMPGMISLHMLLAMLLLIVLIVAYQRALRKVSADFPIILSRIGLAATAIVLLQILLGSRLREAIDVAHDALGDGQRENWLAFTGNTYSMHRFFYYVVAAIIFYFAYRLKPFFTTSVLLKRLTYSMTAFLLIEIGLGLAMHYFAIPAAAQPFHLLFSTLIFANVFYLTRLVTVEKAP